MEVIRDVPSTSLACFVYDRLMYWAHWLEKLASSQDGGHGKLKCDAWEQLITVNPTRAWRFHRRLLVVTIILVKVLALHLTPAHNQMNPGKSACSVELPNLAAMQSFTILRERAKIRLRHYKKALFSHFAFW